MIFKRKLLQEFLGSKWAKLVFICLSQVTIAFKGHQLSLTFKEAHLPALIPQYNKGEAYIAGTV